MNTIDTDGAQHTPGLFGRAGSPTHRRVVHAAPMDQTDYFGKALCGRAPSTRWHGWQWPLPGEDLKYWGVSCARCLAAIAKATGSASS